MSNNRSVEIVSYPNPCSDRLYDDVPQGIILDFLADENSARIEAGRPDGFLDEAGDDKFEGTGAYFLRKYPDSVIKVPEIDAWYDKVTGWMPPDVENWWIEQFKTNAHLDPMRQDWWRQRTRKLIAAHDKGDDNRTIGNLAITTVYMSERDKYSKRLPEFEKQAFYEFRADVIDESYRGEGIGMKVLQKALAEVTMSGLNIPTVAITTNPAAARMFKKMNATTLPSRANGFRHGSPESDVYNALACWSRYNRGNLESRSCGETTSLPCDACPIKYETAWWWPTDNAKRMDELEILEAA